MKALLILLVVFATPAHADSKDTAAAHYRQGKAFHEAKQFKLAIAEYKAAYELDKLPSHLFNIARAHHEAGELANAIEHYQKFLVAEPQSARSADARRYVAEATNTLAEIEAKKKADEAAERAASEARRRDHENRKAAAAAHVKQAEAHAQAGSWSKAGDEHRAAFAADDEPLHLLAAAEAFRKQPDLGKAREALQAYASKVPTGETTDRARATIAELTTAIDKIEADRRAKELLEKERRNKEKEDADRRERERLAKQRIDAELAHGDTHWSGLKKVGFVVGVVGVAGLAIGGSLGIKAIRERSLSDGDCTDAGTCTDAAASQLDAARSSARSSDIAIVVGSSLAITGLAIWLAAPDRRAGGIALRPTANGATITGRF